MKIRVGDMAHVTNEDGTAFVGRVFWHDAWKVEVESGNRTVTVPTEQVARYFDFNQANSVFDLAFKLAHTEEPLVEGYETCALCGAARYGKLIAREQHKTDCPWAAARKLLGLEIPQ